MKIEKPLKEPPIFGVTGHGTQNFIPMESRYSYGAIGASGYYIPELEQYIAMVDDKLPA
jgi:hypothetical protein